MDVLLPAAPKGFTALSQASRFHVADTASTSHEIDIRDIHISVGNKDLLEGAHLKLNAGVRYGLIGRNGVGKSILLKSIAYRWLPGVPKDVKVFYVDQLEDRTDGMDMEVIEWVMRADQKQAQNRDEIARLEAALATDDVDAMQAAILDSRRRRMQKEVAAAAEKVARTSGTRGVSARRQLKQLEDKLSALEISTNEAASTEIHDLLQPLYNDTEDEATCRARAERILVDLKFPGAMIHQPFGTLSGGWRMRVALAMAIFVEARIILLDEPTNHMDLPGIVKLKKFIQTLDDVTLVIVSHDRAFLDDTVDEIIHLQAQKLTYYSGNYEAYVTTVAEQKAHRARQRESLARKHDRLEQSLQEAHSQAKKSGDAKKQSQMASRQRKLEERHGVEANALGHRFKLNRDRAGYHHTLRDDVQEEVVEPTVVWKLPAPPLLRSRGPLLAVEDVSFAYGKGAPPVLEHVTMTIEAGSRVAIIGANGQGKTTLMSLLSGKLEPSQGRVAVHPQARLAYFEQHFVDDARALEESPLAYLAARHEGVKEQELYAHLGSFGLQGAMARQPLRSLSGGQVVRFAFACLTMAAPHALLLDEPSNHLDLDAIEALADALSAFAGAVVVVSHDVYFVRKLANENVYTVKDRAVRLTGAP